MRKTNEDSTNALLRQFLHKVYSFRYLYIICLFIFVSIAFLYNKYSPTVFQITATVGPSQENKATMLSTNKIFSGSNGYYNQGPNIDDILSTLRSFSLVSSVVNSMNLEVGYFTEKKSIFKQTNELYQNSPVSINYDKSHIQPIYTKFYIQPLNDSIFRLTATNKKTSLYNYIDNEIVRKNLSFKIDTICKFNKTITSKYFKFSVARNRDITLSEYSPNDLFYFELYHLEQISQIYLESLNVAPISMLSSIIRVQFTGQNLSKSLKFLETYTNMFLEENLAKKNKMSVSSINFIDSQISEISDSLNLSESKLSNYKSNNQVTDLSFQGQHIYNQMAQIESERVNLEAQIQYYNYLIKYFRTNQDMAGLVPPISANVADPLMNQLITDLISYSTERSSLLNTNSNEKNLFLEPIENKIKLQKQAIIENATNNLNSRNISLNELNYRSEKLSKEIASLPKTEFNVVNMQRKFNLNDAIFTFLLQKRSEAAIALASNFPEYEVVEPARAINADVIKPRTKLSYFFALFLGLFLPTAFFLVKDFFNDKISGAYDIEQITNRSVFVSIYNNQKKYDNVVIASPNSPVSESFRNLRSSIFRRLQNVKGSKVILISSSHPQEGKSFISLNLAASLATVGIKTMLIDIDLRRPVLNTKLNITNSRGVSSYMSKNATIADIIHKTDTENLSFIPAGPLLSNPLELIDAGALEKLFQTLTSEYEYIIIDTPPLGLVADAIQLMKYSSQVLLITRNNATSKTLLANSAKMLEVNGINDYDIILNDLNVKESLYSSYSNYYIKD